MAKSMRAGRVVVLIVLGIQPAAAQTAEPAGGRGPDASVRMAEELAVMELALANAVNRGAQTVEQQFSGSFPGLVLFTGHTQVRGFRIADFGAFFDVEFPVLRQHIFWSMQMLEPDVRVRLRIFEGRLEPERVVSSGDRSRTGFGAPDVTEPQQTGGANGAAVTASEGRSERPLLSAHALYEQAVEERLVEAVLQHGSHLAAMLDGDDWLQVTARDVRGLRGRDTTLRIWWDDAVRSRDCAFRIRAADLIALHQGQLTLEEARARISVEPF